MILSEKANNKGANQSARMRRLVCADAQAGLRLCCLQTPEDRFSRVEAHLFTRCDQKVLGPICSVRFIELKSLSVGHLI